MYLISVITKSVAKRMPEKIIAEEAAKTARLKEYHFVHKLLL